MRGASWAVSVKSRIDDRRNRSVAGNDFLSILMEGTCMNIEQAVKRWYGGVSLVHWLTAVGQLAVLVALATALLLPAPLIPNRLPAGRPHSDLMISSWPTALLIQRTFAQEHRLPLWNPFYGGGQPLGADPLAALFYPPTFLVPFVSLRDYYLVLFMGHLVFAGLG